MRSRISLMFCVNCSGVVCAWAVSKCHDTFSECARNQIKASLRVMDSEDLNATACNHGVVLKATSARGLSISGKCADAENARYASNDRLSATNKPACALAWISCKSWRNCSMCCACSRALLGSWGIGGAWMTQLRCAFCNRRQPAFDSSESNSNADSSVSERVILCVLGMKKATVV